MRYLQGAMLLSTCALANASEPAPQPLDFYIGSDLQRVNLKINGADDDAGLINLSLRGGIFLFEGIALEIQTGVTDSDDDLAGVPVELGANQAVFVRLQTPRREGFLFDLGLGFAHTELEATDPITGITETQKEDGFAWSARVDYRVNSNWHVNFDYTDRTNSNEITLNSYGLGVSYLF
ncbi:porin family protein [Alteromonas lipolytica]|uniref:Outer membrane protein beta-barrel domain-containing protein n=1 Tax=Alteromonas lipolytica TaxID=1856405 RepID=A0A1E8FBV2_9ALTE|nr:porin family protein [Alteromonas lipolytica]OFI33395.1 hypothetical protein BFC17_03795 [Alteromonas lipolytica]GGF60072.1 hypothetical protein GCM10011338_10430 [Alteromonas lipolytica]